MNRLTLACMYLTTTLLSLTSGAQTVLTRKPVDPVGFATKAWQMDSVMARIQREFGNEITDARQQAGVEKFTLWKTAICPHDDYAYASWLYPAVLQNVKAGTVILIGVAHKAKQFRLEDKMIFGSFTRWACPYGPVNVSRYQETLTNGLPRSTYMVHDSMMTVEHSLEAIVPFLQYYNRSVEIIPILVPYMNFGTMKGLAISLAKAIQGLMVQEGLQWNKDLAIVISTDAVHYGDEDWGGKNCDPYGTDSAGYRQAMNHEYELIRSDLSGPLSQKKIEAFFNSTVQPDNYKEYQWTWCGRYSVPFGLLTSEILSQFTHTPLKGSLIGYMNSINHPVLKVDDLKMGTTAVANMHHWVGYCGMGYR